MSISALRVEALASDVTFHRGRMLVRFTDGRELTVPLEWFPRLQNATVAQRKHWQLVGGGIGIHWPDIDEDISIENLLLPKGSVLRTRK
jgi:hypothetical protein